MSKTSAIIKVKLKTSNCNIEIKNGHIGNWFLNWKNCIITAYTYLSYDAHTKSSFFEQSKVLEDLVLLIDVLTLVTNQDINTSVVISTEPTIDSYVGKIRHKSKSVDDFCTEIQFLKHRSNESCLNSNDSQRIDSNSSLHLSNEALLVIGTLFERLSAINNYSKVSKKLINYWRKGVDLDQLQFVDESFLAYYKIIEYIAKKVNLSDKNIPEKYTRNTSMKTAYKFMIGAKLKNPTTSQYKMLSDFIDIRNNWDIAHSKIRPLPANHTSALYYSYMYAIWEFHSHICQITRLTLLRELGISGLSLVNDGGLYSLVCE